MLINNLERHRDKYSQQKNQHRVLKRPSSLNLIPKRCPKTQNRFSSKHSSRSNFTSQTIHHPNSQTLIKNKNIKCFNDIDSYQSQISFNFSAPSDRIPIQSLQKISIKKNNRKTEKPIEKYHDENLSITSQRLRENYNTVHNTPQFMKEVESINFKKKIIEKKNKRTFQVQMKSLEIQDESNSSEILTATKSSQKQSNRTNIFKKQGKKSITTQASNFLQKMPFMIKSSSQLSQILLDPPSVQNQQKYIETLKFSNVFFCIKCLRYVFVVEKYYHFPKCQNQLKIVGMDIEERKKIGFKRLDMIKQLSQYTNTKIDLIKELDKLIQNQQISDNIYQSIIKIPQINDIRNFYNQRRYLSLQQIDLAYNLVVIKLLTEQLKQRNKQNISQMLKNRGSLLCKGINLDRNNELDIV